MLNYSKASGSKHNPLKALHSSNVDLSFKKLQGRRPHCDPKYFVKELFLPALETWGVCCCCCVRWKPCLVNHGPDEDGCWEAGASLDRKTLSEAASAPPVPKASPLFVWRPGCGLSSCSSGCWCKAFWRLRQSQSRHEFGPCPSRRPPRSEPWGRIEPGQEVLT